ncbi:EI24 domain-containing protein [Actinokineospora pegani]|uniref:EI24 domain-containing protein n=1 Tax=Actinokineospora pegani TaxID=2654637 RepID=UPI0012EA2FCF|nr:EI24 domain-containing protein [Actinokineospora pegani]
MINVVRDFGTGVGLLARGVRLVLGSGGLLVRGALPVLVTSVVLFAALVSLALGIGGIVEWATPFADDWSEVWRAALRTAMGIGVVIGAAALGMVAFSALTLIIGSPFYESIAEEVEDRELGGVPEAQRIGWGRAAWMGLRDGVRLAGMAVLFGLGLFVAGFIPVLGQTVVPVVGVFVGAWLLGVELCAIPFVRRGVSLRERRRALGRRRAMTLGFAVPVYLLCLVPLVALVVFPGAMAGGTLLAARVREEG